MCPADQVFTIAPTSLMRHRTFIPRATLHRHTVADLKDLANVKRDLFQRLAERSQRR